MWNMFFLTFVRIQFIYLVREHVDPEGPFNTAILVRCVSIVNLSDTNDSKIITQYLDMKPGEIALPGFGITSTYVEHNAISSKKL